MATPTPQQLDEAILRATPTPPAPVGGESVSPGSSAGGAPTQEQLEAALGSAYDRATQAGTGWAYPGTSAAEKRQAVLLGTGVGAVSGATVAGSTIAGMKLGAKLPLPKLPAITVGGALGFATGLTGSSFINSLLESQIPPRYVSDASLVPYYQGGKTFGEVIGGAPLAYGLPVMQGNRVANFISNMGVEARNAPKTAAAQQLFSGVGAGTLGGLSLSYNPESDGSRFIAETAGGMFSPPKLLLSAAVFAGAA